MAEQNKNSYMGVAKNRLLVNIQNIIKDDKNLDSVIKNTLDYIEPLIMMWEYNKKLAELEYNIDELKFYAKLPNMDESHYEECRTSIILAEGLHGETDEAIKELLKTYKLY